MNQSSISPLKRNGSEKWPIPHSAFRIPHIDKRAANGARVHFHHQMLQLSTFHKHCTASIVFSSAAGLSCRSDGVRQPATTPRCPTRPHSPGSFQINREMHYYITSHYAADSKILDSIFFCFFFVKTFFFSSDFSARGAVVNTHNMEGKKSFQWDYWILECGGGAKKKNKIKRENNRCYLTKRHG